ncbi:hypothetical protein QZH41_018905, partial [Actinostola sp. cb2023]
MAGEASDLQKHLISALLDSGITRDAIVKAIDSMLSKPQERVLRKPSELVEKQCKSEPVGRAQYMSDSGSSDGESIKDDYADEIPQVSQSPLLNPDSVGDHLLRMDPWQAARVMKMYMQQHNIPQREVVESTGLNQSHLSQHLNKGTPMKSQKRAILYNWFERKQKEVALLSKPLNTVTQENDCILMTLSRVHPKSRDGIDLNGDLRRPTCCTTLTNNNVILRKKKVTIVINAIIIIIIVTIVINAIIIIIIVINVIIVSSIIIIVTPRQSNGFLSDPIKKRADASHPIKLFLMIRQGAVPVRETLVVQCNKAECEQRGVPYSNVGGLGPNLVTESRVYNWFANRRKEETFRMKLAIEAASYQDTPGQALASLTSQLPPIAPKMTYVNTPTSHVSSAHLRQALPSSVLTSYPATSSTFQPPVNHTMAAGVPVNHTMAAGVQVLPGVATLMQSSENIESDVLSSQQVIPVMSSQVPDRSMMLCNNTTAGSSPQFAASPQLAMSTMSRSTHQMIPSNASLALQAMASTVRQISVQPIPITTFSNTPSSIAANTTAFIPQTMIMTPASVPSVNVSHTARSPVATIEHLATPLRPHESERHSMHNPSLSVQDVKKQILQETNDQSCLLQQDPDDGAQGINGEHVIHHVIQAISHVGDVGKEEIEKDLAESEGEAEDAIDGLSLAVKMEVNGENVEDVDSIAETVTVETTTSGKNTPVKELKHENVTQSPLPTQAVIVRVNGNHDDTR